MRVIKNNISNIIYPDKMNQITIFLQSDIYKIDEILLRLP
jgi:hypothetical protein